MEDMRNARRDQESSRRESQREARDPSHWTSSQKARRPAGGLRLVFCRVEEEEEEEKRKRKNLARSWNEDGMRKKQLIIVLGLKEYLQTFRKGGLSVSLEYTKDREWRHQIRRCWSSGPLILSSQIKRNITAYLLKEENIERSSCCIQPVFITAHSSSFVCVNSCVIGYKLVQLVITPRHSFWERSFAFLTVCSCQLFACGSYLWCYVETKKMLESSSGLVRFSRFVRKPVREQIHK